MRLLSNLHVKGKPAVLPDRAIRRQSHYFIYRPRTMGLLYFFYLVPHRRYVIAFSFEVFLLVHLLFCSTSIRMPVKEVMLFLETRGLQIPRNFFVFRQQPTQIFSCNRNKDPLYIKNVVPYIRRVSPL